MCIKFSCSVPRKEEVLSPPNLIQEEMSVYLDLVAQALLLKFLATEDISHLSKIAIVHYI